MKFVRMSNGTYAVIRDLGLVKGGKGLKHHDVVLAFGLASVSALIQKTVEAMRRSPGAPIRAGSQTNLEIG